MAAAAAGLHRTEGSVWLRDSLTCGPEETETVAGTVCTPSRQSRGACGASPGPELEQGGCWAWRAEAWDRFPSSICPPPRTCTPPWPSAEAEQWPLRDVHILIPGTFHAKGTLQLGLGLLNWLPGWSRRAWCNDKGPGSLQVRERQGSGPAGSAGAWRGGRSPGAPCDVWPPEHERIECVALSHRVCGNLFWQRWKRKPYWPLPAPWESGGLSQADPVECHAGRRVGWQVPLLR